jgi:anti-sigma regulatory factor (Ser/Thr protein kinase)
VPDLELEESETIDMRLRMRPPWSFIDQLRRFTEAFCASACLDEPRREQVALAVHELTQNAVTHGGGAPIEVALRVDARARTIRVAVSNRCGTEAFAALDARVARLRGTDPLASYLAEVQIARDTPGGLGLVRIRYEADLELEAAAGPGTVTVVATGSTESRSPSED